MAYVTSGSRGEAQFSPTFAKNVALHPDYSSRADSVSLVDRSLNLRFHFLWHRTVLCQISMDPATIAGLVLGIAPLIISAVENYETTFQYFVTYRRYAREINKFATRLDAQKAIFNNQCQLLLLAAERHGQQEDVILDNILKDPNHPSRSNEALNKHLGELLGASLETCVSTLRLIHQTLEEITRETKGFEELSNKKVSRTSSYEQFRKRNIYRLLLFRLPQFNFRSSPTGAVSH